MTQRRNFGLREFSATMAAAMLLSGSTSTAATASAVRATVADAERSLPVAVVDPACKPVFDATHKTLDTPNHLYSDQSDGQGRKTTGELITLNGDRYVFYNGKWSKSRMTVAATKAQEEENIKNAKVLSCKRAGDDVVNGDAATVYIEHTENEDTKSDGKIWVSKSRGVVLKEEIDLDSGTAEHQHIAMRYEFGNVKAPI